MNCPFYARAITYRPAQIGDTVVIGMGDLNLIENHGSNQCAFIIEAHSPCVMGDREKDAGLADMPIAG